MNDRYAPPTAPVADIVDSPARPTWLRTGLLVLAFGGLSLALAWMVAPMGAALIATLLGADEADSSNLFILLDLVLSALVFFLGCYLAARLSRGHAFVAAAGVGGMGWLVYFLAVGGVEGMLDGDFPLWYEFFPSHILTALVAWFLARRRV